MHAMYHTFSNSYKNCGGEIKGKQSKFITKAINHFSFVFVPFSVEVDFEYDWTLTVHLILLWLDFHATEKFEAAEDLSDRESLKKVL